MNKLVSVSCRTKSGTLFPLFSKNCHFSYKFTRQSNSDFLSILLKSMISLPFQIITIHDCNPRVIYRIQLTKNLNTSFFFNAHRKCHNAIHPQPSSPIDENHRVLLINYRVEWCPNSIHSLIGLHNSAPSLTFRISSRHTRQHMLPVPWGRELLFDMMVPTKIFLWEKWCKKNLVRILMVCENIGHLGWFFLKHWFLREKLKEDNRKLISSQEK